eukprot:gene2384-2531_t
MSQKTPYQPNFVINLPYRNKIPPAPYGPYFKTIDILTSLKDEVPEYRTSTIEKNYVWQPHFGPDVGINIDLVDHDSILVADANAQANIHPDDRKYINYVSNDKVKGKYQKSSFDQQSKPWWLRNTTYLENNPFNKSSTLKEENPKHRTRDLKKKLADPLLEQFSIEYIDKTFSLTDETVQRLQNQNKDKKKLVSSKPIMPLFEGDNTGRSKKRLHSLVRFDEDPKFVVNAVSGAGEGKFKKYKIDDSIATNVRDPVSKDNTTTAKGVDITLVAPVAEDENYSRNKEEHLYEWVKDYRMEVHQDAPNSNFVVIVDEENQKVHYLAIDSRIDMKKLTLDQSIPQDCLVIRED